jgi:arabinofuranosyltransferase
MSLRYAAILVSLLCLVFYSLYIQPWMFDDAYIFFRYAENLTRGNGLVYNVGERVEGYTSFLWLMLMSAGDLAGLNIIIFSKITGLIFAAGCILLTAFSYKFIDNVTPAMAAIATLFLGTTGIFLPWGVSGIETTMFAFLVLLQVLYYISIRNNGSRRQFSFLGAIAAIATLTRPEGALVFLVIVLDQLLRRQTEKRSVYRYAILFFVLLIIPHFIWRLVYYGYPLPNSFYAKVGFGISQVLRGCRYMVKFGIPALLIILPLIDPPAIKGLLKRRSVLFPAFTIVILYTVYIILVGGDYMPGVRFFTPIMPIICILSSYVILTSFSRRIVPFLVSAIVLYNIYMLSFYYITPQIILEPVAVAGKEVGLWLKENAAPDAVIATNTAGSIPYYSGLKTIDMLGLNDIHIAHRKMPDMGTRYAGHEKADGRYILNRKPDYIQFWSSLGWETPVFRSDWELYELPEFHKQYELKRITLPSGKVLMIFERRRETKAAKHFTE